MDESRYSRNIALFGEGGQRKITATTAAIIGLGDLGSHVAQQLAYLGVVRYLLIDDDVEDAAAALIQKANVVFGCLDRESPRLFLTDLCSAFKITYFDLATDTGGEDEDWYGGQFSCPENAGRPKPAGARLMSGGRAPD